MADAEAEAEADEDEIAITRFKEPEGIDLSDETQDFRFLTA